MAKKHYAVRQGKEPGIYNTWGECQAQVIGFKGAEYKSFKKLEEAESYMDNKKNTASIYEGIDKEMELKNTVLAYVDGSYSKQHHIYSYGCVILEKNKRTDLKAIGTDKSITNMRNVAGELLGCMTAVQWAINNNYEKIIVHYDYTGIEYWATGEWKRKQKGTQNYKTFIDKANESIKIEFVKIEAHTGDTYNEEADRLAKEAISDHTKSHISR